MGRVTAPSTMARTSVTLAIEGFWTTVWWSSYTNGLWRAFRYTTPPSRAAAAIRT